MTRTLVPIVCLALAFTAVLADKGPGHRERLEDPRIKVPAGDKAGTDAPPVVRGNFQSFQVNIDAAGDNIAGDAANEPSMAIDPTNPDNVVIGWRQFDTITSNFRQAGVAYSHDGGTSWTFPGVLQPGQFRSDPVLAADTQGTFFYYSLSSTTTAEMFISTDKGVNWSGPISAQGGDKTWLTADTTQSIGQDHLYALWNSQFTCCGFGTDYTRSIDGGQSYQGPFATPNKPKWGTLDVGPDGELYLVGTRVSSGFPQLHLILKSDSAKDSGSNPTFESTVGLDLGGSTVTGTTPNPGGLAGQVWVAVDRSGGATNGNVYVLGSVDVPGGDPLDVMFIRSTDGGQSWSAPLRVNDVAAGWQWFGTMSVAPDGRIDVVWNDTRNDASGQTSESYYAYSTDAGASFSAGIPFTPAWNSLVGHPNQNKIGDYYDMVSDADGAGLAYSATFNGEQDVYYVRLGDCNLNGAHDANDVAGGASVDCNLNQLPDECEDTVICAECDADGVCESGEDCDNCSSDCFTGPAGCGNGVCEPTLGEDCVSCADDCNGRQKGNPGNRYCCGDGDGDNPVGCGDSRCAAGGNSCSGTPVDPTCCGDGVCEGTESGTNCEIDCGPGGGFCGDGICDAGEDCVGCSSDCDGKQNGKPANRFCCGNGVLEAAEGDGTRCNGNP